MNNQILFKFQLLPWLKWLIVLVGVAVILSLGYYVGRNTVSNEEANNLDASMTEVVLEKSEGGINYYTNWPNLAFALPYEWSIPLTEVITDGPISYPYVTFFSETSKYSLNINVSNRYDIRNGTPFRGTEDEDSAARIAKLNELNTVFSSRGVKNIAWKDGNDVSRLPGTNAATYAFSTPEYVENADGSLRGLMYLAASGQDNTSMINFLAYLTDGKDNVIEFALYPKENSEEYDRNYKKQIDELNDILANEVSDGNVSRYEQTQTEFNNLYQSFYDYVETLSTTSAKEQKLTTDIKNVFLPMIAKIHFTESPF